MKGYTDFMAGFFGPGVVATKPIGAMKYMDWNKVQKIVDEHPNSVIRAGLMEDWNNTSGLIILSYKISFHKILTVYINEKERGPSFLRPLSF